MRSRYRPPSSPPYLHPPHKHGFLLQLVQHAPIPSILFHNFRPLGTFSRDIRTPPPVRRPDFSPRSEEGGPIQIPSIARIQLKGWWKSSTLQYTSAFGEASGFRKGDVESSPLQGHQPTLPEFHYGPRCQVHVCRRICLRPQPHQGSAGLPRKHQNVDPFQFGSEIISPGSRPAVDHGHKRVRRLKLDTLVMCATSCQYSPYPRGGEWVPLQINFCICSFDRRSGASWVGGLGLGRVEEVRWVFQTYDRRRCVGLQRGRPFPRPV